MNHSAADSMNQTVSAGSACQELPVPSSAREELDESALSGLEARILDRIESRLQKFQSQTLSCLVSALSGRLEPFIEKKVLERVAQGASSGMDADKVRETVVAVIQGSLIESGILEKLVDRAVASRGGAGGGGDSGGASDAQVAKVVDDRIAHAGQTIGAQCIEQIRKEVASIAQKESAAALAGENIKILIDDKFRAISLYLKTDVIPKTVAQILKTTKKPGTP